MSDSTLSTLSNIRTKVRRLTRSPSTNQLTDTEIDNEVNNFLLYDLPAGLKLTDLRTNLTFFLEPYIDTYANNTTDADDPLYNFINKYTNFYSTCYCAGRQMAFYQSQAEFYGIYPALESSISIGTGNGTTTAYSGTLTDIPIMRNRVAFTSVTTANTGVTAYDDGAGALNGDVASAGTINYVTGAYSFTYSTAPASGKKIYAQTVPYSTGRPVSLLYYDDKFVVRPIPDQPYRVQVEADIRPTELLISSSQPQIAQWWQYIAYGAAKKIFENRMDAESVQKILAEFNKQEDLVLSRTLVGLYANDRAATIYSQPYAPLFTAPDLTNTE